MLKKIYICNLQNQNSILRVKGNKSGLLFKQAMYRHIILLLHGRLTGLTPRKLSISYDAYDSVMFPFKGLLKIGSIFNVSS